MAATDNLDSLDRLLQATRDQHKDEMKGVNDQLLASQLELSLTKDALAKQQERMAVAERFSVKLVTQFAMVDAALTLANKAFSDARSAALSATVSIDDNIKIKETNDQVNTLVANGDNGGKPHYTPPPQGYTPPRQPGVPQGQGIDPDAPHG